MTGVKVTEKIRNVAKSDNKIDDFIKTLNM